MPELQITAAAALLLTAAASGQTAKLAPPLIVEDIAISPDGERIAFAFAGDLWSLEVAGGAAVRLSDAPDEERLPVYSPDGKSIAFARENGTNADVWVMPAAPGGGDAARRLTWHPERDVPRGWTPDGSAVLIASRRDDDRTPRLYTVPAKGGFPQALPLRRGRQGAYAPDGSCLAFVPISIGFERTEWRDYRGGATSEILLADPADGSIVERVPRGGGNDRFPMWAGDRLLLVSDRSGVFELCEYDRAAGAVRALTVSTGYGIRSASACRSRVAFVRDGAIHVYDLASGDVRAVPFSIEADVDAWQPRSVTAADTLQWTTVTGGGAQVVMAARGEIFLIDPMTDVWKNLTETPGVAERRPAVSPAGGTLAYLSDASGEYEIVLRPLQGPGEPRSLRIEPEPTFYDDLRWSPGSRRIALSDARLRLWLVDVERGSAAVIDESPWTGQASWTPAWSPDGRFLAYARADGPGRRTVFVHDVAAGVSHALGDGGAYGESPVFDRSGRWLYFIAGADAALAPAAGTDWPLQSSREREPLTSRRVCMVILRDEPAPILPLIGGTNPAAPLEVATETRIDFDGLDSRIVQLPLGASDYARLEVGPPGIIFAQSRQWPSPPAGATPVRPIVRFNVVEPTVMSRFLGDAEGWEMSPDGGTMLFVSGRNWGLKAEDAWSDDQIIFLSLVSPRVTLDVRAEWRQIYAEAFRAMREGFYDGGHHGVDLAALAARYEPWLDGLTRRRDLNRLLRLAFGQLAAGSILVSGGDDGPPSGAPAARGGLLGADVVIDRGRYRFERVYRSGHYASSNLLVTAPLDRPGARVEPGEYLIAIDGRPIGAERNIHEHLQDAAFRPIQLTVGPAPDGAGARTIVTVPLGSSGDLRRAGRAAERRRLVEERSGGRLGYVAIFDHGRGLDDAVREVLDQRGREGLIIDQRGSPGGVMADGLIELLARETWFHDAPRRGRDVAVPPATTPRVKVLITDENDRAEAESFAFMFRLRGLGPIVGRTTLGAGLETTLPGRGLIDGGVIGVPDRAAFDGQWLIGGAGVRPDVDVEITAGDWRAGRDSQLEKAVEVALQALEALEPLERGPETPAPIRPEYPVHK